jgi:hypothetical protein
VRSCREVYDVRAAIAVAKCPGDVRAAIAVAKCPGKRGKQGNRSLYPNMSAAVVVPRSVLHHLAVKPFLQKEGLENDIGIAQWISKALGPLSRLCAL